MPIHQDFFNWNQQNLFYQHSAVSAFVIWEQNPSKSPFPLKQCLFVPSLPSLTAHKHFVWVSLTCSQLEKESSVSPQRRKSVGQVPEFIFHWPINGKAENNKAWMNSNLWKVSALLQVGNSIKAQRTSKNFTSPTRAHKSWIKDFW